MCRMGGIEVSLVFVLDFVSLGFFSCVSLISGVVFFYSIFYMGGTVDIRRFSWLVFLFVVSIFLLVFSGNFFVVMVGWDGLGLVSFCLVVFYVNSCSLESGLLTVFRNRIGDAFFLVCFFFMFLAGNFSWDLFSFDVYFVFCVLIFLGAITKSAQLPFRAWLPAAIAAPTPVSSLVHSSTLVTAGVYVLIRFNYFFSLFGSFFLRTVFLFTMVLAGVCATLEKDFKKVVAMSTLRQLGIMMFILSVGGWVLAYLHMMIHALFKSILFLSTGSVIGQLGGLQDSRYYGGLSFSFRSFLFFVSRGFCLAGFPFFIGFYSKDFIISSFSFYVGTLFFILFFVGCVFTVSYSVRLVREGYIFMIKYSNHRSFFEGSYFFLPVLLLFMKCWILGGVFYLVFLFDFTYFMTLLDLVLGVTLLFVGGIVFYFLKLSYFLVVSFSSILFFRWLTTSASSFLFRGIPFSYFEGSWLEVFGGGGVYSSLRHSNYFVFFYDKIRLGWIIFIVFLVSFWFF